MCLREQKRYIKKQIAATAATQPIAMPAVAPDARPLELGEEGFAVVEVMVEVAGVVWDEEIGEELLPVNVPRAVVTGLRRTVDVYPEYAVQPYPTESCS